MSENLVEQEQPKKYQWLKGDNAGTLEQEKAVSGGFVIFESGRRIKEDLLWEFLVQVHTDMDVLDVNDMPKVRTQADIEAETGLKFEGSTDKKASPIQQAAKNVEPENPIRILLEKQSKNNKVKIELEFDVNVPKKEVIELLQNSFEEDFNEEVIKFAKDKLNKQEIIDKVYNKLDESIKMYYS